MNIIQTRLLGLGAIALLCGAAVAVAGPIGFVGLVVPHVIRRLVSEDIRLALPLAAPVGRWCCCSRISPPAPGGAAGAGDRGDDCAGWRSGIYLYCGEVFK